MQQYDVIIIGTGSGGLSAGLTLHELGFRILFIEKEAGNVGGECLNTGCVPSKALIHVSNMIQQARRATDFGLAEPGPVDFERVKAYIRSVQAQIREHENPDYFRKQGIEMVIGEARFVNRRTLAVGETQYTAKKIVLATGSEVVRLDVPGLDQIHWVDYAAIFALATLPKRLLVVGGGPVGVELGQAFSRLGAAVTIVQSGSQILPHETPEIANALQSLLEQEGIQIMLHTKVTAFPDAHTALVEQGQARQEHRLAFDVALVSIGRKPYLHGLDLEKAGILLEKGRLRVNKRLQTTNPDVYVCGDVSGDHQFSHAAELQASVLVNNLISPFKKKLSYRHFSWVTFTDPEVATFGQSAKELKKQGIKFQTLSLEFGEDDRATIGNYRYGKTRLYTTPAGIWPGRSTILGGTMLAPLAGEMVQELILAMHQKLPIQALFGKTYPYPVASRVNKALVLTQLRKALQPWMKKVLRWVFRRF